MVLLTERNNYVILVLPGTDADDGRRNQERFLGVFMMLKVGITWALLIGIILYEVHSSFTEYYKDRRRWKLVIHTVLLLIFSIMTLQLGLFALRMQFDAPRPPDPMFRFMPSKHITPAGKKPVLHNKAQKIRKKQAFGVHQSPAF
jgi:hypothetical protein